MQRNESAVKRRQAVKRRLLARPLTTKKLLLIKGFFYVLNARASRKPIGLSRGTMNLEIQSARVTIRGESREPDGRTMFREDFSNRYLFVRGVIPLRKLGVNTVSCVVKMFPYFLSRSCVHLVLLLQLLLY